MADEPRAPVLGGPRYRAPAPPFFGGSPVALLAPVPKPFIPIDFSKPLFRLVQTPQAQPNLTIILPLAPPIIPFDWPKPYVIRPVVPQPLSNLTIILPPPVPPLVPGLCFARDIPVVSASANDIPAVLVKASDSRSGQGWSGAGFMSLYEIDTTIELLGIFINSLTGVYADPTSITLFILDPSGVQTSQIWPGGAIVRDSLGHFHFIMTPAKSGNWTYKWQGFGTAQATSQDTIFTVNASALIPG
jgi:hypothetical protein